MSAFRSSPREQRPLTITSVSAVQTFYVVRAASAKFGLHAGNMKFSTQNDE
jgi:hypothetical protein